MITLNIDGKAMHVDAEPDTPLLWVLRDTLQITGTKYGCGMGLCGACSVHMNNEPVRSCSTPVSAAAGKKIVTIEDVDQSRVGKPVQAGASARSMQVLAAANRWDVPRAQFTVADGVVMHKASGRKATFGELARAAGDEALPSDVKLKAPKNFKLIGKRIPRKDSADMLKA